MAFVFFAILMVGLTELAFAAGYYGWDCPARHLHDAISKRRRS